jgi:NAD(P)-dependent dehydrogenase (short-subunit alcohol dehydrogenase family)
MDKYNQNKKVLITGCSSGFGLLTAVEAAKAGFQVIATMRNMTKAQYLSDALKQANVDAAIEHLDVTNQQSITEVIVKHAPIDILVNNAGTLIMGSCLDISEEEMRKVFETNYFGAVALTRAVLPDMIKNRSGLIINVASLAGLMGHLFNAAYSASKHALIGFTRSIRLELKAHNIKVVSVEPGYHKTEIIRANANLADNFYDRQSPMFQYNRGFLRLMMKKVIPRAAEPSTVATKIVQIMKTPNPKNHYIIGKDAHIASVLHRLGLMRPLENQIYKKLLTATERENLREQQKKQKDKKSKPPLTKGSDPFS